MPIAPVTMTVVERRNILGVQRLYVIAYLRVA